MEPWAWLVGFALLTVANVASWRGRDGGRRWPWILWIAPVCLGLHGLGFVLATVGPSEPSTAAWLAMTVVAGLGAVPCLVASFRNRGAARLVAALNALALGSLAVRVVLFVNSIRLM